MRISDRYIGKQVLLGTVYAVMVLGVVLVLGNLFKEIKPLLVDMKAPLTLVVRFVISVLPLSLMYTVPWGFLSAVLLVFGRLSSEQEITAFRVGGTSLYRLAAPVFVIGVLLSGLSLWLNINVVPTSKATLLQLFYQQASKDPDSLLKPGVVQGDLGTKGETVKVLIEGKQDDWVEGFHLYQLGSEPGAQHSYVHADRAALAVDDVKNQLRIKLEKAYFETREPGKPVQMAFAGLAEPLVVDLKDPKPRKLRGSAMTNEEIRHAVATNPDIPEPKKIKLLAEITKRYSFSMACISFAFIAVPLGLTSRRRESSGGLVISLLIGTGYFLFTIIADQFETSSASTAVLWAPNIACVLIGLFLFRRARFK